MNIYRYTISAKLTARLSTLPKDTTEKTWLMGRRGSSALIGSPTSDGAMKKTPGPLHCSAGWPFRLSISSGELHTRYIGWSLFSDMSEDYTN